MTNFHGEEANYVLEWMGLNFYYYDGLQPEMSAGIINEHECRLTSTSWSLYLQVYFPVSQNLAFSSLRLETKGFCPISVTVTCSLVLLKK